MSTPHDVASARFLCEELDMEIVKVASADIVDGFLHQYLTTTKADVILSNGLASLGEIEKALEYYGEHQDDIALLHCVSNYPCSDQSLNLSALEVLAKAFDLAVGYSDHSIDGFAN